MKDLLITLLLITLGTLGTAQELSDVVGTLHVYTGDGVESRQSTLDGFTARNNGRDGFLAENNRFGFIADNNTLDGFRAVNGQASGFVAANNSDFGYTATNNTQGGFFAENNVVNGIETKGNGGAGILSQGNTGPGILSQGNMGPAAFLDGDIILPAIDDIPLANSNGLPILVIDPAGKVYKTTMDVASLVGDQQTSLKEKSKEIAYLKSELENLSVEVNKLKELVKDVMAQDR